MNSKFSLIDGVVVLCVGLAAFSVMTPALVQTKEESKLKACENRMKGLALATLNKESATMRFPLALSGRRANVKIDRRGPRPFSEEDGYGFAVGLLPYMDGTKKLYDQLAGKSEQFSVPLNSEKLKDEDGKSLFSGMIEGLLCPTNEEDHAMVQGKHGGLGPAQVSNYLAMVAGCVDGSRQTLADINPTTGGMIVTRQASPKGLRIGDCKDGLSKTFILSESKAELFAFWASGVSTVSVAIPPDVAQCSRITRNKPDGYPTPREGVPSGINYGGGAPEESGGGSDGDAKDTTKWFAESIGSVPRDWGPSSRHVGGKVNHVFCDGHVKAFTKEIDPKAYFRLNTRGGAEPLDSDQL